ncbi:MAG: selenide, water dikinase SelD [marine benthic group bacterium]|nr:selenide, water dikinase SelD [Gemmatimonadota bacterium]MCL7983821.1 selenide, water dikinase SelD [Gemmatimonadota bacterium]
MLSALPAGVDENLLVGLETPDDAAVYALEADRALVASVDFFPPLVDDPEDFGAIAAANALSDLYAMRARPLFALSLLAIPAGELPPEAVAAILRGASDTCAEAGAVIAGGHSIDDAEPKFGLVAIGLVHPDRMLRKAGALPGDALVLGKALGTGVVATAIKRGMADAPATRAAVRSMRQLNAAATELLDGHEVHALTDVSGFGLLGHLREMCEASNVSARVFAGAPRLLPDAEHLVEEGCVPGGTSRNRASLESVTSWADAVPETLRTLLCDAQTSGGLLASVASEDASELVAEWETAGYAASVIGQLEFPTADRIRVEA